MFSVIVFITVTTCVLATDVTTSFSKTQHDYLCQPWYNYDLTNEQCVCTKRRVYGSSYYYNVECGEHSAIIANGYCTTYEEGNGTFIAICLYFQSKGLNSTSDGYIFPQNTSELNEYMCRQMKRKNRLCSDCIDGFGPSFTSPDFECSNCTGRQYGVPLYLLVELGPITMLYLIIAVIHISVTSAPMTGYIMYSQFIMYLLVIDRRPPLRSIVLNQNTHTQIGVKVILALYGIWNLDPIRYLVPPFCISAKLNATHVAFLGYISAFYPLCLIFLTWVFIELHGRNFKPIVLMWRPVHRFIVKLRKGCDLKNDMVGVFASFFFLSYSKLMYQSVMLLTCQTMTISNDNRTSQVTLIDPNTVCHSSQHLLVAIPAMLILLFCTILPSILFLLYSTRKFKACLSKCRVNGQYLAILNIFMEKYHSCCRDGLNGGRDMRIFSGLYFVLRALSGLYNCIRFLNITFWTYQTIIFSSAALVIAIIKPYKKTYVNILDVLQLALAALLCLLLSQDDKFINQTQLFVLCILPALGFFSYNILSGTKRLRRRIIDYFEQTRCRKVRKPDMYDSSIAELLTHPTCTTVDIPNYESIRQH